MEYYNIFSIYFKCFVFAVLTWSDEVYWNCRFVFKTLQFALIVIAKECLCLSIHIWGSATNPLIDTVTAASDQNSSLFAYTIFHPVIERICPTDKGRRVVLGNKVKYKRYFRYWDCHSWYRRGSPHCSGQLHYGRNKW